MYKWVMGDGWCANVHEVWDRESERESEGSLQENCAEKINRFQRIWSTAGTYTTDSIL